MTFKSPIIPYLIRATYDWISDAHFIPYIEIDTSYPGMEIPPQFSNEKTIVLNIAAQAVNRLKIDNKAIEFDARFGSQINHLYIPMPAILAIYARENGFGMQLIPTIEYLGENIEFIDITSTAKPVIIGKSSQKIGTQTKPKLKLITKERCTKDSDPKKTK
jgi:stringent starvation protein B